MRRAAKRDGNEREIVNALRKVGCTVYYVSQSELWDLAVYHPASERWIMAEIKMPKKGKLRAHQDWDGVQVWRSVDDALTGVGVIRGW